MDRRANDAGARRTARETLQEHGIRALPVDPQDIANAISLPVTTRSDCPPDMFGALCYYDSQYQIVLSDRCPTDGHRRFTLAHELGHYFLDGHHDAMFSGGSSTYVSATTHFRGTRKPWFEREADVFAAELLAPYPLTHTLITSTPPSLHGIQQLAESCATSLSCAGIQFAAACREPVAVLLSHEGVLEWAALSDAMREYRWARVSLKGEWVPPKCATRTLTQLGEAASTDGLSQTGLLAEWFEGAPAVIVTEEAMRLGSYARVLTVLTAMTLRPPEYDDARERRDADAGATWTSTLRGWQLDRYEDLYDD